MTGVVARRAAEIPADPLAPKLAELVDRLMPIFADAAVGVFTRDLDIPAEEDELTPIYVGVQVMLEVIRENLDELHELNASLGRKVADQTASLQRARVARPLVRRIVRELSEGAHVKESALRSVGEGLARNALADDLPRFLEVYEEMGLGRIELHERQADRYVFHARDLLERRERARMPTCFLAVGFLSGAVSSLHESVAVLGSELACQSRGDPECRFVVRVAGRSGGAPVASPV